MPINIVFPIAGKGTRFLAKSEDFPEYKKPKPLICIAGQPMIKWATASIPGFDYANKIFIVNEEHVDEYKIDKEIKKIYSDSIVVIQKTPLTGAVTTVLQAKKYIDNIDPLIISDCDHYIDGRSHLEMINIIRPDGAIPTFFSTDKKWSYTKIGKDNNAIEIAEKNPISTHANLGIYYFGKGKEFVECAETMIEKNQKINNEFYVAPVYNYLIARGGKVIISKPEFMYGLGTPDDVDIFIRLLKERKIDYPF